MKPVLRDIKPNTCFVCGKTKQEEPPVGRVFMLQGKKVYFCGFHAEAFQQGHNIGRTSLHETLVEFLSDLDDSATGWELKRKVYELIPHAKVQLLENRRIVRLADRTPKSLFDALEATVVGQNKAKTLISLAVYKHLQSLKATTKSKVPDKHNILLLGPSGCGKTLIAHTIAQELELPFVSGDATSLSPTGYAGGDADHLISDLMEEANHVVEIAQRGAIFVDEIDKLATSQAIMDREQHSANTQATLLRLIEGKVVKSPSSAQQAMMNQVPQQNVDTSKILWFFGGAFPGLSKIVGKKMGYSGKRIGFTSQVENKSEALLEEAIQSYEILSTAPIEVLVESLIEYGLTPEFVGRVPTIAPLAPLNKEELMKCLCILDHSPVKKQERLFSACGYELEFDPEILSSIVETSAKMATGTRALNTLIGQSVMSASFDLLGPTTPALKGKVTITKDCLTDSSKYELKKQPKIVPVPSLVSEFSS